MEVEEIKRLATVIEAHSNMSERLDKVETKVDTVVETTTVISTQLKDFFIRDDRKKREHDNKIAKQAEMQTATDLEVARLKTRFKIGAGIFSTSGIAAIIHKLFY